MNDDTPFDSEVRSIKNAKEGEYSKHLEDEFNRESLRLTRKDAEELNRRKKHTVHYVWVVIMWIAVIMFIVVVINWLLPSSWQWLNSEVKLFLSTMYVSGLIGYLFNSSKFLS